MRTFSGPNRFTRRLRRADPRAAVDNNTALVSVEGQILRTAFLINGWLTTPKKSRSFCELRVNDDMATNGRYPLVVTNYEERFE